MAHNVVEYDNGQYFLRGRNVQISDDSLFGLARKVVDNMAKIIDVGGGVWLPPPITPEDSVRLGYNGFDADEFWKIINAGKNKLYG